MSGGGKLGVGAARVPRRQLENRLPDHPVPDPERVQEVGHRHPAPRSKGGVGPDEAEVLGGYRPPAQEAGAQRVVVLGDVLGDVGQEHRIVDRRVRGDGRANRAQRVLGQLGPARREHLGDAFHVGYAGHEHALKP